MPQKSCQQSIRHGVVGHPLQAPPGTLEVEAALEFLSPVGRLQALLLVASHMVWLTPRYGASVMETQMLLATLPKLETAVHNGFVANRVRLPPVLRMLHLAGPL